MDSHQASSPRSRTVHLVALLALVVALGSMAVAGAAHAAVASDPSYLVTFAAGTSDSDQQSAITSAGATDVSSVGPLRMHTVTAPADTADAVVAALQADSSVTSVEADRPRNVSATVSDPGYTQQWSLSRIGWDQLFGTVTPSGNATVAILDTGVNASHEDLAGKVVPGTSILDPFSDGTTDPNGHGTEMAGIVAAAADNGVGIDGIGYAGVNIMPVTVLNAGGYGQDSDIVNGIVYAADHGADVILMSFANTGFSQALQDAIDYAWSKGAVLVAAAGNGGSDTVNFPAGDRGVIGVANTDENDALNATSNYGEDVFMAAPGTDIYTTAGDGAYTTITGTSASAAEVAGAAAFVRASDPSATNGIVVSRLARNADAITASVGNGRLNMARAAGDAGIDALEPAGASPVGGGGPFVGPYVAAANNANGSITPSTTSGPVGTSVSITSSGGPFSGSGSISVKFDSVTQATCSQVSGGNFSGTCSFTVPSATTGAHTVLVTDGTGSRQFVFTVTASDTTAPAISLTQENGSAATFPLSTNQTIASVGGSCGTATGDNGTVSVSVSGNGAQTGTATCSSGAWTYTLSPSVSAEGTSTVTATQSDAAGNTGSSGSVSITVDKTAPSVVITQVNGNPQSFPFSINQSVTSVGGTCSTGDGPVAVTRDGSSTAPASAARTSGTWTLTLTAPISGEGTYGFGAGQTDSAGNTGTATSRSVTIDTTAPGVAVSQVNGAAQGFPYSTNQTITSVGGTCGTASGDASAVHLTFSGDSTETGSVTCASGSWTYTLMTALSSAGSYSVTATQSDVAGNSGTSGASAITVDKTAPAVSLTQVNGSSASFPLSTNHTVSSVGGDCGNASGDNASVHVTLTAASSEAGSVPCVSGSWTYTLSNSLASDGSVSVSATQSDAAGNSGASGSKSITVDKTAPQVTIASLAGSGGTSSSSPFAVATNAGATITGHASENGSAVVRRGGTDCSSGTVVASSSYTSAPGSASLIVDAADLPAGTDTLRVCVTDAAGNTGASEDLTVVKDVTAPTVASITRADAESTNASSVSWHVSFSEPVTGVDMTDFALARGGLVSGASITGVTGSGAEYTVTASSGDGDGTIGLNLVDDDSIVDAAANPLGGAGADNGSATGEVYAIDKTAPTAIVTAPASPTNSQPLDYGVTFSEPVSDLAASGVSVGGSADESTATTTVSKIDSKHFTVRVDSLAGDGTVTVAVSAGAVQDGAGNANTATETASVLYDTTKPTSSATSGAYSSAAETAIPVTFSSADAGSGVASVQLYVEGPTDTGYSAYGDPQAPAQDGTGSFSVDPSEGDGTYRFYTRASDTAGNTEDAPTQADDTTTVTVSDTKTLRDSAAPVTGNDAPAAWQNADTTVNLTPVDPGADQNPPTGSGVASTTWWVDDATDHNSGTTAAVPTSAGQGAHTLHFYSTDNAGNVEPDETATVKIDTLAPVSSDNADSAWHNTDQTVHLSASDAGASATPATGSGVKEIHYTLDDGQEQSVAGNSADVSVPTSAGDGEHTISYWAVDDAGNAEVAHDATVKIDTTAPAISDRGTTQTPNVAGWFNTPVTNEFEASDAGSGLDADCKSAFALDSSNKYVQTKTTSGDGSAVKVTSDACNDVTGNHSDGLDSATFKVDTTAPSSNAAPLPTYNNDGTIDISYNDTDATSGVRRVDLYVTVPGASSPTLAMSDVAGDATHPIDGHFNYAVPSSGGDYVQGTYSFFTRATDVADNAEAAPATADARIKQTDQDSIAPSLTVGHTPDGDNGWNKTSPVTVSVAASDSNSGLASGSPSCKEGDSALTLSSSGSGSWTTSVSGEGIHTIDCQATDNAGNQSTASDTVKIDTIGPTITDLGTTQSPNAAGWFNTDVTNRFSVIDAGSGLSASCTTAYSGAGASESKTTTGESAHETVTSDSCTDLAGNTQAGVTSATFKVDKTAPATSDNVDGNWHNQAVTVTLTAADGANGSGVAHTYYTIGADPAQPTTASAEYDSTQKPTLNNGEKIRYFSVDHAGNSESDHTSAAAKVDLATPTSAASSGQYDNKGSITVSYTAADTGGSGLASVKLYVEGPNDSSYSLANTDTNPASGHTFNVPAATDGRYSMYTVARDVAGNEESKSAADTSTIEDNRAPSIQITTPADQSTQIKGTTLTANFTCNDGTGDVSGVSTCNPSLAIGSGSANPLSPPWTLDTASVGAHTFSVATTDKAGNGASKSAGYTVVYNSDGKFMSPVTNVPDTTVNKVKAGQAVPLKFSLHGNQGLSIFTPGYPVSQQILSPGSLDTTTLQTDTAGSSSLSYDATSDTYTYVWKTDKGWANTSRQLVILLNDGFTYFRANFSFTK